MMKRHISCFSIVVVILLLSGFNSEAQQISKTQLELRAKHNFVSGNFESALSDFRLLYNNYPKNEEYCYFLGRCLLNTNRELEFAIKLLKYSSINGGRADAHYYLGEVYKKLYRLDDAYIALTTFLNIADKQEKKKLNPEYEMECIERMTSSTAQGQFLHILDKQEVQDVAFEKGYERVVQGTIIHKPDEFTLKKDREMNYEGLMYLPEDLEDGNYIYFAGYEENLKGGLQIFRVKKISDNEYTFPEPLSETINTDFDEEYPYFDYSTSTLYFASKGHYSFGGYDIFKSSYDSLTDSWSKPEQLDFPLNTPFDDYFYVVNKKQGKAVLASNRESKTKKVTVYTIKAEDPPQYLKLTKPDEKRELAMLDIQEPEIKSNDQETEISGDKNYEDLLFEALSHQSKADSLLILLREKRSKSINADNENQRKVLLAEAGLLENQYRRAQDKADKMFEEANAVKPKDTGMKTVVAENREAEKNENITLKEERDDLKVYEFVASTAASTTASQPVKSDKLIIQPQKEEKKIRKKEFEILSYLPYNNTNPIPRNIELPEGLVYRIQLGAFSNEVSADAFRGLFPVTAEVLHNNKITKYYVGYFSHSSDARNALEKVKEYGYPDAFLVPFYNNEKISISKAREIEFDQNKF